VNYAIVVGIDWYVNTAWQLEGAVADALAFADWAVSRGGVPPANLRLLLSRSAADATENARTSAASDHVGRVSLEEAGVEVAYSWAGRRGIRRAMDELANGVAGVGVERLFVYFAGHGCSEPGSRPEPVLIPADVQDLGVDADLLIGFSQVWPFLSEAEPRLQFYFIDACRDFLFSGRERGLAPVVGRYRPVDGAVTSKQYVIFATSPGQRANEHLGRGVFGKELLRALQGEAPRASPWNARTGSYQLSFRTLSDFLRQSVDAELQRAFGANLRSYAQLPQQDSPRDEPDALLCSFAEMPDRRLRVRVGPVEARREGTVLVGHLHAGGGFLATFTQPPPLPLPLELALPPDVYAVRVTAPSYETSTAIRELYEDTPVDIALAPTTSIDVMTPVAIVPIAKLMRGPSSVLFESDPASVLVAIDDLGKSVRSALGSLRISGAPGGFVRVRLLTPDGRKLERHEEVRRGVRGRVRLEADPKPWRPPGLQELPIELACAPWASVLGLAVADGGLRRKLPALEGLATPSTPGDSATGSLTVIVATDEVAPVSHGAFAELEGTQGTTELALRGVDGLPGVCVARAFGLRGSLRLRLSVEGYSSTECALYILSASETVFVVVAGQSGGAAVHAYCVPADAPSPQVNGEVLRGLSGGPRAQSGVRLQDAVQRFMMGWIKLPDEVVDLFTDTSSMEPADPWLLCVVGYAALRSGRTTPGLGQRLRRLGVAYPDWPDARLLAAFAARSTEERDAGLASALLAGVPAVSDGVVLLSRWRHGQQGLVSKVLPPASARLSDSLWTAW
jgi:hypothetical protein